MRSGVPAAPVWRLVEDRKARYGLSWDEVAAWLGTWALPVVYCQEMPASAARSILARIDAGYTATEGTKTAMHHQKVVDREIHYYTGKLKVPKDRKKP